MKKLSLILLPLLAWGCSSKPLKPDGARAPLAPNTFYVFESKVKLHDKKKDENSHLNLDIVTDGSANLRIDATGLLGINIASLGLTKNYLTLLLYREKKYYYGVPQAESLQKLIHIKLNVYDLQKILADINLSKKDWKCELDKMGLPISCQNNFSDLKITWQKREVEYREIQISSADFELQLEITQKIDKLINDYFNIFSLKAPNNYKKIAL